MPTDRQAAAADCSKPRLLVLASTYPRWPGDPEPGFVHELARRLIDRFEVRVLCPHAHGARTEETMDGVQVTRYRYAPARFETLVNDGGIVANLRRKPLKWLLVPLFLLAQGWAARQLIRRWRPTVVHAHWLIPQGLIVAMFSMFQRGMPPFLVTSHGADLHALRFWPMPALKRFVVGRAAAVTVVSSAMLDSMRTQGIPTEKVAIEPMGVDLRQRFTPSDTVRRSSNEILFVGRLVEKKGLRYLVEAMPAIIERHPAAHLTVAGFGPEEAALRRQVESLRIAERVNFLGAVPQEKLPELYRRAALFVAPFVEAEGGDQEGLGLVAIEAIGCGCPVLVSDLPAVRDVVDNPAMRVPPADSARLAELVNRALGAGQAALAPSIADLGKALISRFDWQARAKVYADVLAGMAPGGNASR